MKDFDLSISPIDAYEIPDVPVFGENNSDLLKKMPGRWQKNAKIIAGLGLVGAFALSGCVNAVSESLLSDVEKNLGYVQSNIIREVRPNNVEHDFNYTQGGYGSYNSYSEADLLVRIHTGGGGGSAYMVHLTEQEAFGIIQVRLEAAGLVFDAMPPSGVIFPPIQVGDTIYGEADWHLREVVGSVDLDLFDAQKGVGVAHVNWLGASQAFMPSERELAGRIGEAFAEQLGNIMVGVFYNPGRSVGSGGEWSDEGMWILAHPLDEEVEALRPLLVRQLINQADEFIARLQLEGVLEQFPSIDVVINDTAFAFGESPIIINNYLMVPAIELFEALEMRISEDANEFRIVTSGSESGITVHVSVGLQSFNTGSNISVTRYGNREWLSDIPAMMYNDTILIPLQFVAETIGATVDWNEDTRAIIISH